MEVSCFYVLHCERNSDHICVCLFNSLQIVIPLGLRKIRDNFFLFLMVLGDVLMKIEEMT